MIEELVSMLDKRVESGGVIRRRWVQVPKSQVEERLKEGWTLKLEQPSLRSGRYTKKVADE
jgi:hypothetical protein